MAKQAESKEQINILAIVSYRVRPITTGGQKSIALFYEYFSKLVNLTCVTVKSAKENAGEYTFDMIPLFADTSSRYINPSYFFSLKKIVQQKKITHIMIDHPYFGWLAILLKKVLGVKLIVRSHNIEGIRFKSIGKWWWKILWQYEKRVHRAADINFFVTNEDMQYAVNSFGIKMNTCAVIPFGIEREEAPSQQEKIKAKQKVCQQHKLDATKPLLLYSATFNYLPNLQGLDFIIKQLNPILKESGQAYNILISGSKLPGTYNKLSDYADNNITYAGFVDDIDLYFSAADIFLNPISEGGGIKTKLVEALAANCSVISFENGAIGIPAGITGKKLDVVANNNVKLFADKTLNACTLSDENIPSAFFNFFSWKSIAERAKEKIETSS